MVGWSLADALRVLHEELIAGLQDGDDSGLPLALHDVVIDLRAVLVTTMAGEASWRVIAPEESVELGATQRITVTLSPYGTAERDGATGIGIGEGHSGPVGHDYVSSPLISGRLDAPAGQAPGRGVRTDVDTAASFSDGWINFWVEDQAPGGGFERGRWYTLAIDVSRQKDVRAIGSTTIADLLPDDVDDVDLTVQAFGWGAEVDGGARALPIRRTEERSKTVRFDFRPTNDSCQLHVVISRQRSACVTAVIRIECGQSGKGPEVVFSRRPWRVIPRTPARDIGVVLSTDGELIRCAYSDEEFQDSGLLGLDRDGLTNLCRPLYDAVDELMEVLSTDPALKVLEDAVSLFDLPPGKITAETEDATRGYRNEMATAGRTLFESLFMAGDDGAKRIGHRIQQWGAADRAMRIQILTKTDFHLPWGLLYLDPYIPLHDPGRWEMFLGTRHLIEELADPLLEVSDREFPSSRSFTLSFSGYTSTALNDVSVSAETQRQYLMTLAHKSLTAAKVKNRPGVKGALEALGNASPGDLVYLFCHGETRGPEEIGGQGGANLRFGPDTPADVLTLAGLRHAAKSQEYGRGAPIVVVNACQIGRRSPADRQDLISYLLARKARGVIAATAFVPTAFAASWAVGFFDRLMTGAEIGPTLLELSEAAVRAWGVPLGLLYTANCALETRIASELVTPAQ